MAAAANAGDRKPILIQHSQGTREQANLVDSGDVAHGQQWSYLIAERGHFIFNDAPIPPGARPPTGSVLTLIVNARTSDVTDSGLSNRYPDLAKLGPVRTDFGWASYAPAPSVLPTQTDYDCGAGKILATRGPLIPAAQGTVGGHHWALETDQGRPRASAVRAGRFLLDGHAYGLCRDPVDLGLIDAPPLRDRLRLRA